VTSNVRKDFQDGEITFIMSLIQVYYNHLKEKHPQLASRAIFTTGYGMGEDTQSFLEQAARPFLPKPFTLDKLKTIMRETLEEVEK
jgi:DNA-binding NtrC family response regulator